MKKKIGVILIVLAMAIAVAVSALLWKRGSNVFDKLMQSVDKPILYIYPEEDTEISVTLGKPDKITCSYPLYNGNWTVIAHPGGTLTDVNTGRQFYALYWEGLSAIHTDRNEEKGFVVRGRDSAAFLEDKLATLGLNEREAEEFIVYWLPRLEANEYNFIYFETKEEIEEDMPLGFSIQPDTVIRVRMEFKPVDMDYSAEEQNLKTVKRTGLTVVEWGGIELR